MKIDWGSLGMGLGIIAVIVGCSYLFWYANWGEPRELAQHGQDTVGLVLSVKSHNARAGSKYFTQYWHVVKYDGHTKIFVLEDPYPVGSTLAVRYVPDAPDKARLAVESREPVSDSGFGKFFRQVKNIFFGVIFSITLLGFLFLGGYLVFGALHG